MYPQEQRQACLSVEHHEASIWWRYFRNVSPTIPDLSLNPDQAAVRANAQQLAPDSATSYVRISENTFKQLFSNSKISLKNLSIRC